MSKNKINGVIIGAGGVYDIVCFLTEINGVLFFIDFSKNTRGGREWVVQTYLGFF